ncbi:hypothetical protein P280DRAFT_121766 [Massarina eburnea CBS 473.64]|uniref:Uncharacterized protein n=1 Tax=Massarina eburnea CBS 473.64 TaxID=1395130 RepID=A0A6A6SGE3_9PLEO|nr:hypothetical protein P280DRAFT_121766 [Massarina eburnea CBS 473.64]
MTTMFYTIHIPSHPHTPFTTPSLSIASDFRSWGYRVDALASLPSSASSPKPTPMSTPTSTSTTQPRTHFTATHSTTDRRSATELMDLWNTEWLRRFCLSRALGTTTLFDAPLHYYDDSANINIPSFDFDHGTLGPENFTEGARGVTQGSRREAARERVRDRQRNTAWIWSDWGFGWGFGLAGLMGLAGGEIEVVEREVRGSSEDEDQLPRYERGEEPPPYRE